MLQDAFRSLSKIAKELETVEQVLDDELANPRCTGSIRVTVTEARSQLEKTYLLRLLSEFEGLLELIGPTLRVPVTFTDQDGLGTKLDRIGANLTMDGTFRLEIDDKIRAHRNDLFHGRTPILRVRFNASHMLMKAFLRNCW
jgi:hypothetical protein